MKDQKQREYEVPQTTCLEVELEQGFMKASVYEGGTENASGVTIEEHQVNTTVENYFDNPTGGDSWNTWDE